MRNTGRFIMYSGIINICYRKTLGHVFTKPVQTEGTTQKKKSSPSKLFFIVVHISAARRCDFMQWENGRSEGEVVLCAGISHSKSVVTLQRAFRAKYANVFVPPLPRDLADLKARIIAAVKNIDVPMLTCVWQELEYRTAVCRVAHGARIELL